MTRFLTLLAFLAGLGGGALLLTGSGGLSSVEASEDRGSCQEIARALDEGYGVTEIGRTTCRAAEAR